MVPFGCFCAERFEKVQTNKKIIKSLLIMLWMSECIYEFNFRAKLDSKFVENLDWSDCRSFNNFTQCEAVKINKIGIIQSEMTGSAYFVSDCQS